MVVGFVASGKNEAASSNQATDRRCSRTGTVSHSQTLISSEGARQYQSSVFLHLIDLAANGLLILHVSPNGDIRHTAESSRTTLLSTRRRPWKTTGCVVISNFGCL